MSIAADHNTAFAPVRLFARPRPIAFACIVVLAGAGWAALGLMIADTSLLAALCRPAAAGTGVAQAGTIFSMWCAMSLAMMLPTAAPMIVTYADIAEAAAAKREPVVSPLVLIAGYLAIWLAVAAALTVLQVALARLALLGATSAVATPLAAALFGIAGLYQFSSLKHACATQCQRPMPFFFANWTDRPSGIFKLGLRQGLYCLGCCWAMMLLMFAVGAMNVVWMAALGALMAIEKTTSRFSRPLGIAFLLAGAALIVSHFA